MSRPICYELARWRENKPICRWCFIPCDPMSREYRAAHLCGYCYDEQPKLTIQPKRLICPQP